MNWILDKFNQAEKVIMDEVTTVSSVDGNATQTATPAVAQPTVAEQIVAMVGPQLAGLIKIGIDDAMKGNFAGAWGDVKGQLINDGIQDAITATRALEQSVMSHIGTLGTSKQLDVAKGKLTDAFIWIEKHLGVGG